MSVDERYLSPVIFMTDFSDAATAESHRFTTAKEATAKEAKFKENWLQDAIAKNPELVLAACRVSGLITDERWRFWAKEVSAGDAGSIDLLLISESGRVGIVETKLSYNRGARREVVAQILEYAISLSSVSHLPPIPIIDGRPFAYEEDMRYSLQKGDYLLIVAGDRLDFRAVKLSEALLGKHLLRAWDLALVEIAVFEPLAESGQKAHLLVPHIRGTIVPVSRQIVTIDIKGDRTRIEATPGTPAAIGEGWDEGKFFKEVQPSTAPSPLRKFAEELRRLPQEYPNVSLAFGRGKEATLTLRKEGKGIVSLYMNSNSLTFNKPSFSQALGEQWGDYYERKLEVLFPEEMNKKDWVIIKLRPNSAQRDLGELLAILTDLLAKSALDEEQLDQMTMV
jgi:hypothetical protein